MIETLACNGMVMVMVMGWVREFSPDRSGSNGSHIAVIRISKYVNHQRRYFSFFENYNKNELLILPSFFALPKWGVQNRIRKKTFFWFIVDNKIVSQDFLSSGFFSKQEIRDLANLFLNRKEDVVNFFNLFSQVLGAKNWRKKWIVEKETMIRNAKERRDIFLSYLESHFSSKFIEISHICDK